MSQDDPSSRLPSWLLLIASLLFTMLLAEGLLRLFPLPLPDRFFEPNQEFGWFHTPGRVGWHRTPELEVPIEINQLGLRDEDHGYAKPADTTRLLLVGDSFVEGLQVRHPATVDEQLEAMLNARSSHPVQVLNAGVSRFGTDNELLFLQQEGLRYQPDLVILFFFYNDLFDNLEEPYFELSDEGLSAVQPAPFNPLGPAERLRGWLWDHFRLYRLGAVVVSAITGGGGAPEREGELPFLVTDAAQRRYSLDLTVALIERMAQLCEEHEAAFLVVGVSERSATRSSDGSAASRINQSIGERLAEVGIHYLDLSAAFRQRYLQTGEELFWPGDAHWNAAGHRLAAVELLSTLEEGPDQLP